MNCAAKDYPIDWKIQAYEPLDVKVGDTVTFTWRGPHGVVTIPTGGCPSSFTGPGVTTLAPVSRGGEYVWTAAKTGTVSTISLRKYEIDCWPAFPSVVHNTFSTPSKRLFQSQVWVACQASDHCDEGQKLKITVA